MGITPLPRYRGPLRLPLAFDRLPVRAGCAADMAPPISRRGEEGLASSLKHALVTVPPLPPRRRGPPRPEEDGPCCLRPLLMGSAFGLDFVEATFAFTLVAARSLAHHPLGGFVDGLQFIRFPS